MCRSLITLIFISVINMINCDDASDMNKCMFTYNDRLSLCYRPLMELVDPESNLCQWKNSTKITQFTITCIHVIAFKQIISMRNQSPRTCASLTRVDTCMRLSGMDQYCYNTVNSVINFPYETLEKHCNDKETYLQEYLDCWNLNPSMSIKDRRLSYYKPELVCTLQDSERLSSEIFALNILLSVPDNMTTDMYGDLNARLHCKQVELNACAERRRHLIFCRMRPYIDMQWWLDFHNLSLNSSCLGDLYCMLLATKYCKLRPETFEVKELYNIGDIQTIVKNSGLTKSIEDMSTVNLFSSNLDPSEDDVKNLLLRQTACFYKTILKPLDVNQLTVPNYLRVYLIKRIDLFRSCWKVYISSYPDTSELLQFIPKFMDGLVKIISHPKIETNGCPLQSLFIDNSLNNKNRYISLSRIISRLGTSRQLASIYKLLNSNEVTYKEKRYAAQLSLLESQNFIMETGDTDPDENLYYVYKSLCGTQLADLHQQLVGNLTKPYGQYLQVLRETALYVGHTID